MDNERQYKKSQSLWVTKHNIKKLDVPNAGQRCKEMDLDNGIESRPTSRMYSNAAGYRYNKIDLIY